MLRAELNPPKKAPRKPFKLTARNEAMLLALGVALAYIVLVNLFLSVAPQPVQGGEGGSPGEASDQPVPAAALPKEGDFTQIVKINCPPQPRRWHQAL